MSNPFCYFYLIFIYWLVSKVFFLHDDTGIILDIDLNPYDPHPGA